MKIGKSAKFPLVNLYEQPTFTFSWICKHSCDGLECVLDSSSHSSLEFLMEKIEGGAQGAI